jgi:hypothetical protein
MTDLDIATKDFAGRRMNRAIAKAIEGKNLVEVEKTVEHALGIEAAHDKGTRTAPSSARDVTRELGK